MRSRPNQSALGSPILIGSLTLLVTLIAVVLAYNANNGLPFVPTRTVKVNFPSGADLVPHNQVYEGGYRVGVVTAMRPVHGAGGITLAQVEMQLDPSVRVPPSSTFTIRALNSLGLKYVQLIQGPGAHSVASGHVFSIAHSGASAGLDTLFDVFDKRTREGTMQTVAGLGDAWAGRGPEVNQALTVLPSALTHLTPVMATLADPGNGLARLLRSLDGTMRVLAPVHGTLAHLFTTMADTYGAIAHDPRALEQTIAKSPSTEAVSTDSLRVQRPFYNDTVPFSDALTRAAAQLGPTLPPLSAALEAGPPVLRRSVVLDRRLAGADRALRDLAKDPFTTITLSDVLGTVGVLRPLIRYLGPYQTVCDYWNYMWTDNQDHMSELDPNGFAERVLLNSAGVQTNGLSSSDSVVPANGEGFVSGTQFRGDPQFLHAQAYGAAVDNHGNADCENGQRGYLSRYSQGLPARFKTVSNTQTPGDQGPTFAGRSHVPKGETFDRIPEGDPHLP